MNLINNIVPIVRLIEHQIVLTYLVETSRHTGCAWVPHTFSQRNLTPELVLSGRRPFSLSIESIKKNKKGVLFQVLFSLKK